MRCFKPFCVLMSLGVLVVLSGVLGGPVRAQSTSATGEDIFHRAAQQYIADNLSAARRIVADGLQKAPGHPKLLALQAKLEQGDAGGSDSTSSEGSGQNESSGDEGASDSAPPSQDDAATPDTPGAQGTPQSRGPESEAPPQARPQDPQEQGADAEANGEVGTEQRRTEEPSGRASGRTSETNRPGTRLSQMQAERILQALADQELKLLREVQQRSTQVPPVEKDW